jgi:hypothetical protein
MAFCVNCGKKMGDRAKFCPSCGTPAGEPQRAEQLKKRPNCGAAPESFQGRCPDCGFELNAAGVTGNVKQFAATMEVLSAAGIKNNNAYWDSKWREMELITTFPVPNNREDLLEFAVLVLGRYNGTGGARIWKTKMEQVYAKARLVFANDPATLERIKSMNDEILAKEKEEAGRLGP